MGVGHSTVSRALRREGLNALAALYPENRYEHRSPGDLLHPDIRKLAHFHQPIHRVTGNWGQGSPRAGWALFQALRYYAGCGVRFRRTVDGVDGVGPR